MNSAVLLSVELRNESHIVLARRRARDTAGLLGFDQQDCVRIATTVSEIARNAWRYAGGGRVEFSLLREGEHDILEITVRDQGPGIANLKEILDGRYKSTTGMGLGLLSGRRLMHRFDVKTSSQGTVVRVGKFLPRRFADPVPAVASRVSEALVKIRTTDAVAEMEEQNRELLQTLSNLEKSQSELSQLNRELEETNRGVVALYAELDDRAQEIQKVVELKSRFLSNITHVFRTPLNSIIGLSRMLLERIDGELSVEQEKQTRFINRAARDLSDLVNDLLDLAKADAGKVELMPVPVSVNELFATLRGMLRPLVEQNTTVALVFDEPQVPVEMICDERKLSQILRNLISNALKYTPHGEVNVSARVTGSRIVFCVRDTGIGIPEEHQDKIFEEFYQVRNPLQQKTKGTGLGLALSRRLVDLLGGTISLQSSVGIGSAFTINLPLSSPGSTPPIPVAGNVTTAATAAVEAEPAAAVPAEKETIVLVLFVDNRVDTLFSYERMLEHTPFKAVLARDTQEALAILKRVSVSAIVTPSYPIAQTLAAALPPSPALIPSFIVTSDETSADDGSAGLIDAFLPASPDATHLVQTLHRLTSHARFIALVVDDNPEARQHLRALLEEFHLNVVEADTAAQALALIKDQKPSLVFADIVLPDSSGIQFVSHLKEVVEDGALVIHSSQVFTEEEREFLKEQAAALVRKGPPSDSSYRTAIIHELARARRRHLRA
ncbi:MAG: ATP-binding protein [Rariglobus sp.]